MNDSTDLEPAEEIATSTGSAQADAAFQARTEALLAELRRAASRRYRNGKRYKLLLTASILYFNGFLVVFGLLHIPVPADLHRILSFLFKLCLIPVVANDVVISLFVMLFTRKRRRRSEQLIQELSEDSRAVGAIAQCC